MKENIYLIRSLSRLLNRTKPDSPFTGFNSAVCRKISNRFTLDRHIARNNDKFFMQRHRAFCLDSIKLYSKKKEIDAVINFYEFSTIENKEKKTFIQMIRLYAEKFPTRKGVVDFINSALLHLKEFGVHKDLDTYKALLNLMPKGPYVPSNIFQVEGVHYPREQDCITNLLCYMEEYGVEPDVEMHDILVAIFGPLGYPVRKYYRMMYWYPKFKNLNPWLLPRPLPTDTITLAQLAIQKITSVDLQTEINVYRTENVKDSIDNTWIVSGQSRDQRSLLQKHDKLKPVIVEGGEHVYLNDQRINFFLLKSDTPYEWKPPKEKFDFSDFKMKHLNPNYEDEDEEEQSVHTQDDGIIYAVCATGTSSKDSLLSWIRLLENNGNPILEDLAVLFRFKKPPHEAVPFTTELTNPEMHEKRNSTNNAEQGSSQSEK